MRRRVRQSTGPSALAWPALDTDHRAVHAAVHHEVPAGAVPEPDRDERQHQVQVYVAASRASEPEIQVVPKETRNRDVPALPEARDAACEVRAIEVQHQVVAEASRSAARDIRVA